MTRRLRGFQKLGGGFKWTRSGFVKLPDRLRSVSIQPQPLWAAKATAIKPKSKRTKHQPKTRLGIKRPEKAKEQGGAVLAPAPDLAKPATPQMARLTGGELCRPDPPPRA